MKPLFMLDAQSCASAVLPSNRHGSITGMDLATVATQGKNRQGSGVGIFVDTKMIDVTRCGAVPPDCAAVGNGARRGRSVSSPKYDIGNGRGSAEGAVRNHGMALGWLSAGTVVSKDNSEAEHSRAARSRD
jgi:hypothetical protein